MTNPCDLSGREADALASMMGADSRRIDDLVGDVGEIKGDMRILKAAIGREFYGRWRRATPMTRFDWVESAQDAAATLAGGAVVLAAAAVGL